MKAILVSATLFLSLASARAENGLQPVKAADYDVAGQKMLINEIESWRTTHLESSPAQKEEFKPLLDQIQKEAEAAKAQSAFERAQDKFQNWKIAFLRRKYNMEPPQVRAAKTFPFYAADAVNAAAEQARVQRNQKHFQATATLASNPNAFFEGLTAHRILSESAVRADPKLEVAAALRSATEKPAVMAVQLNRPIDAPNALGLEEGLDPKDPYKKVKAHLAAGGVSRSIVDQIIKESTRQGVDPRFSLAIVANESRFDPRAESGQGAGGLFQIMPETFKWFNRFSDASLLFDVRHNIRTGIGYIKSLWKSFSGNTLELARLSLDKLQSDDIKKAIAAYNAGPGNVRKYGGVPPFPETRNYVPNVIATLTKFLTL